MTDSVKVRYSCRECGLRDAVVEIIPRTDEDIVVWMKALNVVLSRDHHARSPTCEPKALQDVKIPIGSKQVIGGRITH